MLTNNLTILPNSLAIWGLGQIGLLIQGPDARIIIDPCLSEIVYEDTKDEANKRAFPPPIEADQVTGIDYYLMTHDHIDHFDPLTVGEIMKASPGVKMVTTDWVREGLEEFNPAPGQVMVPEALKPITLPGTSAKITVVPSAHYDRGYEEGRGYRWVGFLIEWNGVTLYHMGDTIIYDGYIDTLKGLPTPDVAMVPVNGRDYFRESVGFIGNLHPEEGVQLASELGWGLVLVGHNDLYRPNTIPMGQIFETFTKFAPRQKVKYLQPGELLYFVKP
jgi:L-ascorbate 6-phosphate lactonase